MFRIVVGLAIVGTLFLGFGIRPMDMTAAANARKSAPDFSLDDSQGKTIRLSDFRGKVVLLDFWATWCHGCMTEIPWYVEFQNKYENSGLAVIGVSMDEDGWKSVKPFLAEHKINYPIVVGKQELQKLYAVETPPVTLLIDREGKIAEAHSRMVEKDAFENEIETLLHEGK